MSRHEFDENKQSRQRHVMWMKAIPKQAASHDGLSSSKRPRGREIIRKKSDP